VLVYDRLNCGASDVAISGDEWEDGMTSGHVVELLRLLGAGPALAVGLAAGNRMSLFLALRHASALRGVVLGWPSGGERAATILAQDYYGQYAEAARRGGMPGVCQTPYYQERIERNPANRERLLAMDQQEFIAATERWRDGFLKSSDWPTIAVREDELRSIRLPVLVLPGLTDDPIHGRATGEAISRLIPGAQVRHLPDERRPAGADGSWLRAALGRRSSSPELSRAILEFSAQLGQSEPRQAPARAG
jgi:pimeloyl-ACP methyl ester carboxylesterase